MRLMPFELKKLFAGNIKWMLLFFLLINAAVYYVYLIPSIPTQTQTELRQKWTGELEEHTAGLAGDEKSEAGLAYLNEKMEGLGQLLVYRTEPEWFTEEEKSQIEELYKNSSYMKLSVERLQEEIAALADIQSEYQASADYRSFIDGMGKRAENMLQIKIFEGDGFSRKNIEKTITDFAKVGDIKVEPVDGTGLVNLQNFYLTDLLLLVLICLLCFQEFGYDQKSGMGNLIQATPKGKVPLRAAQMGGVWLTIAVVSVLLYGSNLLETCTFVLKGSLDVPIQGISSFRNVSFPCSIRMYFVLFLAGKVMAGLFIASFCQLLAVALNGSHLAWLGYGLAVGTSFLLWFLIPDSPISKTFRYLNLVGLLDMGQIVGNYQNLNIFSQPISLLTAALCFVLVAGGIMVAWTMFTAKWSVQFPKVHLPAKSKDGRTASNRILHYEFRKLFGNQKMWWIVIGLIAVSLGTMEPNTGLITGREFYYEQFQDQYKGNYTEEKVQEIGTLYEERFSRDEQQAEGIEKLYDQCEHLKVQAKNDPGNLGIVNLDKLEWFFNDKQGENVKLLIIITALILSLNALFYQDKKKDMDQLFLAVPKGNCVYWKKMWLAALLGAGYAAVIWSVPYIQYFLQTSVEGGQFAAQSIPELAAGGGSITIGGYMAATVVMRCAIGAYVGILVALMCRIFVVPIQNMVCSILIFILPLCLAYVGNMGYENALVHFINEKLAFATGHVKILSGFPQACLSFSPVGWIIFALLPVMGVIIGRRIADFTRRGKK